MRYHQGTQLTEGNDRLETYNMNSDGDLAQAKHWGARSQGNYRGANPMMIPMQPGQNSPRIENRITPTTTFQMPPPAPDRAPVRSVPIKIEPPPHLQQEPANYYWVKNAVERFLNSKKEMANHEFLAHIESQALVTLREVSNIQSIPLAERSGCQKVLDSAGQDPLQHWQFKVLQEFQAINSISSEASGSIRQVNHQHRREYFAGKLVETPNPDQPGNQGGEFLELCDRLAHCPEVAEIAQEICKPNDDNAALVTLRVTVNLAKHLTGNLKFKSPALLTQQELMTQIQEWKSTRIQQHPVQGSLAPAMAPDLNNPIYLSDGASR